MRSRIPGILFTLAFVLAMSALVLLALAKK